VALLNGGAYVGQRVEGGSLPALTVNGVTASKGIHNGGQKISGVADGNVDAASDQAVNGSQLHDTNEALAAEATTRGNADTQIRSELAAEAHTRADADNALSARIDANANAATAQIAASEARSIKASHQSSALAMAVAGMTGATPTGNGRAAIKMGLGFYGGEKAVAIGASYAVSNELTVFGSITNAGDELGAALGAGLSF
jgi:hypothetical protein